MTLVDALVVCLMAFGLVVWIGEPLIRRAAAPREDRTDNKSAEMLFLHKETLYTALRDLDFDFRTGKVDTKDYTELRQQLEGEALQILRQIDHVDPLARLEREIEQRVAAVRSNSMSALGQQADSACPHCSTRLENGDNFCPFCGRDLGRS